MGGVEGAVALALALGLGHGPAGLGGPVGGQVLGLLGGPDTVHGLLPVRVAPVEGVAGRDQRSDGDEGDDGRAGTGMALGDDRDDEDGDQGDADRNGDPAEHPHSPILAAGRACVGSGRQAGRRAGRRDRSAGG